MKPYSDATKRFLLAAKNAEIQALQQLASNCRLVSSVTNVIHQLQRERGMSNVFLASKCELFAQNRTAQIDCCIASEQELRSQLKSLYLSGDVSLGNMRLLNSITLASQGMDNLSTLREKVSKTSVTPLESTQAFCRLIVSLLTVVFDAADVSGDPEVTRLLVALFNFIQGKEYAGQERAWGAIGFAETHFNKSLCARLTQLQQAQAQSFDTFMQFAPSEHLVAFEELEESEATQALQQMRNMICQLADGTPIDSEISEVWYNLATQRIDQMRAIEELLTTQLLATANQKVVQAESELKDHKRQLDSLAHATLLDENSPFSLLFDPAMPGLTGSESQVSGQYVPPVIGMPRSFYDLLREQSANIKQIAHELDEAKQAMSDHKLIDRAKLILMQQYALSEVDAYRRLQKSAMDKSARLVDVAKTVVELVRA